MATNEKCNFLLFCTFSLSSKFAKGRYIDLHTRFGHIFDVIPQYECTGANDLDTDLLCEVAYFLQFCCGSLFNYHATLHEAKSIAKFLSVE